MKSLCFGLARRSAQYAPAGASRWSSPEAFKTRSGATLGLALLVSALLAPPVLATGALPVRVAIVEFTTEAVITDVFPGVAAPRRQSALGFETGGRIASVAVDVGDVVEAGAELAALDVRALDAQIKAAEAGVREARAASELADLTASRQVELVSRGHASTQRLDESQANASVATARVAAAQAQLDVLKVRRDLARLPAPFAGIVVARHLDEGAIAAPGSPILELVERQAVEIRVGVPLAQSETLKAGASYEFRLTDGAATGVLRAKTGVVDRTSQSVAAVFDLDPASSVAPGEIVRLVLPGVLEEPGFWAPISALAEGRRGLWTVMVVREREDGEGEGWTVEPRVVDVLHTEADRVYVRGALTGQEVIVAAGVDRLVAGQAVTPVTEAEVRASLDEPVRK